MKKLICAFLLFSSSTLFSFEDIECDKLSETLGHLIVRHLVNPGFQFNFDKIIQGIEDERKGLTSPMSEEEYEQAIYAIQDNLFQKTAEKNLEIANHFLQENATQEGVHDIEGKIQYKIAHEGQGDLVEMDSVPLIHYKGSLLDGTVFASSEETGQPIALPLKQTIPGFTKGLLGMKEGEKRLLYIHPECAYGVSGHLPPNSLLIFEVEIVKADSQKNAPSKKEAEA